MTREIPILDSCDVLVCGGGFGGISAALAAARLGKRVILLEKQYVLGGLGTAGLITYYLPLCDGVGHQVSFGLAEELLRLSISMGAEDEYPANWLDRTDPAGRTEKDHRFRVRYNPWLFAILAEQELIKAGVKILYGCYAVDTETGENRIHSVIVESISGRQKIRTRTVVDATGDACIAYLAGARRKPISRATFWQPGTTPWAARATGSTGWFFPTFRRRKTPDGRCVPCLTAGSAAWTAGRYRK